MKTTFLDKTFFDRNTLLVAQELLGKIIYHRYNDYWLSAKIIETEAYFLDEKASHASLGYTKKRAALFMPPGTIYMYYSRAGDSLNISCQGSGNAVLIKSAKPWLERPDSQEMLNRLLQNNPIKKSNNFRDAHYVCSGQTLLCRALGLRVPHWDQQQFDPEQFYIADIDYPIEKIIQTTRLGIPEGRDGHLLYRFIDYAEAKYCTSNPLTKRAPPPIVLVAY